MKPVPAKFRTYRIVRFIIGVLLLGAVWLWQMGGMRARPERLVVTNAKLVPGLQLCQPLMLRRQDGTFFIGGPDHLLRLDVSGKVTDLGFGAWNLARDAHDNVYAVRSIKRPDGLAPVALKNGMVRIDPGNQVHVVGDLATSAYGIAVDGQGAIFLQLSRMPHADIDRMAPDGTLSRWTRLERVSQHQNNWAYQAFAIDSHGNVYLGAWGAVVKIDAKSRTASVFAGRDQDRLGPPRDGRGQDAELGAEVTRIAIDSGDNLYVVTHDGPSWLRKIAPDGVVTTLAGRNEPQRHDDEAVHPEELVDGDLRGQSVVAFSSIDVDDGGNVYFLQCAANALRRITPDGRIETLLRGPLNPPSWG